MLRKHHLQIDVTLYNPDTDQKAIVTIHKKYFSLKFKSVKKIYKLISQNRRICGYELDDYVIINFFVKDE